MRSVRVLIIDEEPEFTSILTDRLNSWGFAAVGINNREEVLESLTAVRPEVAILGVKAGERRGLELLSMIKSADPSIEVILLTGKGGTIAGMGGMERGAFDVLVHPIELGVLIERIREAAAAGSSR